MKRCSLFLCFIITLCSNAQDIDSLNTAKDCLYITLPEREMIYEINRVRSNPKSYIQYISPLLNNAKRQLKIAGRGEKNYSLTFSTTSLNGKTTKSVDTTWHYANEEEVRALTTLISDLKKLKALSVLQPDSGIYKAAKKHAADQQAHDWKLLHTGSDGSDPMSRIKLFSPSMSYGNENIGGRYGYATDTPRDMILQLLIDAGIPGYGHRYNILNPQWTHVACSIEKFKGQTWWIQNFGAKKAGLRKE
ncbi:MAG TPA: CAP domain-containing protein [Flavisolibacter sp.]|nr:CAP domain-containing protein [Flavisolibacter sp.]